ncbi:MAG TPA: hypothetical protein VK543_03960 [Puia sp.]|nr:hypothetical protein [Puia sp.]
MNFIPRTIIFLLILCLGVFVLPFYIPTLTKTLSSSYDYHFNNIVSVVGLWLGLLSFIILFHKQVKEKISRISFSGWIKTDLSTSLEKKHLYFPILFYSLIIFLLYILGANYGYGEGAYFLNRIDRLALGQIPYRDFEYAYGVLFIYFPYFINRLFGISSSIPGYSITLVLFSILGLYFFFRLVNSFHIGKKQKLFIFYGFVFCFVPYHNGLNYSLLRYLAPIISILLLFKYHDFIAPRGIGKALYLALLATLLILINFLISVEMGFAVFLSILAYLAFAICFKERLYLVTIIFILILLAGLVYLAGGLDFFLVMKSFTSGAMNWVIIPSPSICFYIVSFLFTNFILSIKLYEQKNASLICLLVFNLLMVSPAFGRCDPPHVLYNGLSVFLFPWLLLAYSNGKYFKRFTVLFFLIFVVVMNISNLLTYKESMGIVVMKKFRDNPKIVRFVTRTAMLLDKDMAKKINGFMQKEQMRADTGLLERYDRIALPFYVDKDIYLYLFNKGSYSPEFYTDLLNVGTEKQVYEKLKILQDQNHRYMIVPERYFDLNRLYSKSEKEEKQFISLLFAFPYSYHKVNESRDMLEPIYRYIIENYDQIAIVKKGYILVKRKGDANPDHK